MDIWGIPSFTVERSYFIIHGKHIGNGFSRDLLHHIQCNFCDEKITVNYTLLEWDVTNNVNNSQRLSEHRGSTKKNAGRKKQHRPTTMTL